MNVIDQYKWRYATKKFDAKKKISDSNIELIKESISLAPTSYGLQLFKVIIVENQEIKNELKKASYNQSQISDASHIFVFCNSTKIIGDDIDTYIKNKSSIQNKPISEISGYGDFLKTTLLKKEHKKVSIWTANQVYIALSHLMTFCPSIGIDSCPVEGFDSYKYNEILNLNNRNLNSTVVAAVGYRSNKDSSQYEKKIRKSNDELFETI
ncbi:MAG: NAD(P)H-dependent oxidoreductase [Bacteroidetes bacterium MED-G20]|nr:MAG: NAD(P)H-dependent oxidoreductase [Bacteroidetes bacterium MED-G20]|tara:strand:+ start:1356 stop:1985 length:630 start_codon:yes stop_codon:yes gene_type:complete